MILCINCSRIFKTNFFEKRNSTFMRNKLKNATDKYALIVSLGQSYGECLFHFDQFFFIVLSQSGGAT